jgi:hypothetical protein
VHQPAAAGAAVRLIVSTNSAATTHATPPRERRPVCLELGVERIRRPPRRKPEPPDFERKSSPDNEFGLSKYATLRCSIGAELPKAPPSAPIKRTLLDEFLVSDLQMFRDTLRSIIPYKTRIDRFTFGCLWFEFSMFANLEPFDKKDVLPLLEKERVEGGNPDFNPWVDLRRRFNVELLEIEPINKK